VTPRRLEEIDAALQQGAEPRAFRAALESVGSLTDPAWLARFSHVCLLSGEWHRAALAAQLAAAQSDDLKYALDLGATLSTGGDFLGALATYQKAALRAPNDLRVRYALAQAWHLLQQMEEAVEAYDGVLETQPNLAEAISHRIVAMNYRHEEQAEILEESRRYGALLGPSRDLTKTYDSGRPLRVGLLSPELREHSCAYFLMPLLERCPADIELYVYHDTVHSDAVTERFKTYATAWHAVAAMSIAALEKQMLVDQLDVALDLNGHFSRARLPVFAHRVAPVQAAYLGYPNTTGVHAMDWRIGDVSIDDDSEQWSERLKLLEGGMFAYHPPEDAPPVTAGPETSVFGYFGHLGKISPNTAKVWARILDACSEGKLVIKGDALSHTGMRAMWVKKFTAWGLPMDRVELREKTRDRASHLAMYGDISVSLDTWPYNGTTTICESLWMGVPVVTMLGRRHASRVAASLIQDLIPVATHETDYVEQALRLARVRYRLSRAELAEVKWLKHDAVAGEFWQAVRQIAHVRTP
jgi:protein O-GlcNAc transferase